MEQILNLREGDISFNLSAEMAMAVNDLKSLKTTVPKIFGDLDLKGGKYFWGYASVDSIDSDGDRIELAALEKASKDLTKAPYNKIFLGHEYKDIAVGMIKATAIDYSKKALVILAKLNDTHQRSNEVWKSINDGFLDGFSIGGSFLKVKPEYDEGLKKYINTIKEVVLREVSLTSIPANPMASLLGAFIKSKTAMDKSENFKYLEDSKKAMEKEIMLKEIAKMEAKIEEFKKDLESSNTNVETEQVEVPAESSDEQVQEGDQPEEAVEEEVEEAVEEPAEEVEESVEEESTEEPVEAAEEPVEEVVEEVEKSIKKDAGEEPAEDNTEEAKEEEAEAPEPEAEPVARKSKVTEAVAPQSEAVPGTKRGQMLGWLKQK